MKKEEGNMLNGDIHIKAIKEVLLKMFELKSSKKLCDVMIEFGNSVIYAHSCILAAWSPFLLDIFMKPSTNEWSVSKPLKLNFIQLFKCKEKVICLNCVEKLINYMYCGQISYDTSHSYHLLMLSKLLGLVDFQKFSINCSLPSGITGDSGKAHSNKLKRKISSENKTLSAAECSNSLNNFVPNPIISHSRNGKEVSAHCPMNPVKNNLDLFVPNSDENFIINDKEQPTEVSALNITPHLKMIENTKITTAEENICNEDSSSLCSANPANNVINSTALNFSDLVENNDSRYGKINDSFQNSRGKTLTLKEDIDDTAISSPIKIQNFNCFKCKLNFDCFKIYNFHKKVFHKKKFICLSCDFTSLKLSYMVFHLLNMNHNENFCSICLYEASDMKSLISHLQEHRNDFPYKCRVCKSAFRSRTEWLRHAANHNTTSELLKCKVCGIECNSKHSLHTHLLTHKEVHLCDVCGFATPSKGQYNRHVETHKNKKNISCPIVPCTFKTLYKFNLKVHLRSHEVSKSFECKICSLKFTLEKNLMRHVKTMHNEENDFYECHFCQYKNARLDKAKVHCELFHAKDPSALEYILNQHEQKKRNKICTRSKKIDEKTQPTETKTEIILNPNVESSGTKNEATKEQEIQESSSIEACGVNGKKTFILSETTGEFNIISENSGEPISVASVTSTNVLTIGNFREGTGSVTLNETTGVLTFNNINSESTGAVFLNESTGELSYINLAKNSQTDEGSRQDVVPKVQTHLNEFTGEIVTVCDDNDIQEFNDDNGLFDSFDMDIGNEDSCDGFDDLDGLLFDPIEFENSEIFLSNNKKHDLTEIPHLNETTGELSFDHVDPQTVSKETWPVHNTTQEKSEEDSKDSYELLLNEVTGELVTGDVNLR